MNVGEIVNLIIDNTFRIIYDVYIKNTEKSDAQLDTQVGSRIIFPKTRSNSIRISEQELRFIFVEQFNKICNQEDYRLFYSVETPTEKMYCFKDKNNPVSGKGQSANIDLVIHDEHGNRVCLMEFKANNPCMGNYLKDFRKLSDEPTGEFRCFIEIVNKSNKGTIKNIKNKSSCKKENVMFRCYDIDNNKEIE